MKQRIIVACIGVPVILVVFYLLPAPFTPALIAILSAIGTYEAMGAMGMNHPRIALYTAALALAIPFGSTLARSGSSACWCSWSTWWSSFWRPLPATSG